MKWLMIFSDDNKHVYYLPRTDEFKLTTDSELTQLYSKEVGMQLRYERTDSKPLNSTGVTCRINPADGVALWVEVPMLPQDLFSMVVSYMYAKVCSKRESLLRRCFIIKSQSGEEFIFESPSEYGFQTHLDNIKRIIDQPHHTETRKNITFATYESPGRDIYSITDGKNCYVINVPEGRLDINQQYEILAEYMAMLGQEAMITINPDKLLKKGKYVLRVSSTGSEINMPDSYDIPVPFDPSDDTGHTTVYAQEFCLQMVEVFELHMNGDVSGKYTLISELQLYAEKHHI